MPLTVEPSKPRLCNDDRFLNLWMINRPFQLDTLRGLPLYVFPGSFQTVSDDKSGYDHILLTDSSKTYFGFEWGGWFFISNTIPFGWKLSAFIYHTTGSVVSSYFRSIGIPCSLYIDDRHTSQIIFSATSPPPVVTPQSVTELNFTLAQVAIFLVCYTLVTLGYTIGLDKSILIPSQSVPFLGFDSDSLNQTFRLLPHKKAKFLLRKEHSLSDARLLVLTSEIVWKMYIVVSSRTRGTSFHERDQHGNFQSYALIKACPRVTCSSSGN